MNANIVFLLNLLSTWYLIGLIWMVQVVHYKMFDRVGTAEFVQYEVDHNRLITPIVAPPMLIELATACALFAFAPPGFPRWATWIGLILIAIVPLTKALPLMGSLWILIGALSYSLGIVFFKVVKFQYHHLVWHLLVVAGTLSHFFAVFFYIIPR